MYEFQFYKYTNKYLLVHQQNTVEEVIGYTQGFRLLQEWFGDNFNLKNIYSSDTCAKWQIVDETELHA